MSLPKDLDDNIGQLFTIGFFGEGVPDDVRTVITRDNIGGTILFSRNISGLEQVVDLNAQLCDLGTTDFPMLVSVDQEGGRVARLRDICTNIPSMRTLGHNARDDEDLPYRVGAMMARELLALGFHMDFAPVVDIDTNPKNPVIGERSFSRDPQTVAQLASSMIRGFQQAGLAACAKHFPGHGDTDTDSHLQLPRVPHDLQRLYDVELVPFAHAAQNHVASIMTAHVLFPAIDDEFPATLSRPVLTGLLRERIGYDGVIVSDDLEMKGVADHYEVEEMVTRGLNAGCDMFLICHTLDKVERAVAAVKKGVTDGTIDANRVRAALSRIADLKARFVGAPARPKLDDARQIVGSAPHQQLVATLLPAEGESDRASSLVDVS